MIQFIHPRIRIIIVLFVAFFVSALLKSYSVGETQTQAPTIQVQSIVADFSRSISNSRERLITSIQSVHAPRFTLFPTFISSSTIAPKQSEQSDLSSSSTVQPDRNESSSGSTQQSSQVQEWNNGSSSSSEIPTSTPAMLLPNSQTEANNPTNPTSVPNQIPNEIPNSIPNAVPTSMIIPTTPTSQSFPTTAPVVIKPTTAPPPTSVPKPTTPPKPTAVPALPPITSDVRPGTSIEAILRDVSSRMCIPYALLMAERTEEAGAWFNNMSASTTKMYNTYGWWTSADKGTICAGLAYYTQSGKIPPDSSQAGPSCTKGVQPGAYDQQIMGLFQVGEAEQTSALTKIKAVISGKVDRRVLYDNAAIFSIITKNRAGKSPQPSCSDWPQETVQLVAEKHFGACQYPGGNYCTEVWNLYKKFK